MSKDVLLEIDILKEHPNRINRIINRIVEEIEALRREGYELYTLTVQKQQECNNEIDALSCEYRECRADLYCSYQNNEGCNPDSLINNQQYRDSQEYDFYTNDLKKRYNKLENRLDKLNHNKEVLDDIAQQVVNIKKTSEDIRQKSEQWNKIYTTVINGLIDLNNRG